MLSKLLKFVIPIGCGCYIVYYTFSILRCRRRFKKIPGDEPTGIYGFFIGSLEKFFNPDGSRKMISKVFYDALQTNKTVKMRITNLPGVITCDPKVIKAVLINEDASKNPITVQSIGYPGGERYLGRGLVTEVDKKRWKHRRALFNPGFQRQALKTFLNEFNAKGNIFINHLKELAQNQTEPIKLLEKFNQTALDIIASVAFSIDVDSINDPSNFFNQYIFESLEGINLFLVDPFVKLRLNKWPKIWHHRKVIRLLRKFGRENIEKRLQAFQKGEELPNDILTTILKTHKDEEFYVEDMVDDFVTFFIAGQETTASALASAFLEIGRHPDIYQKLKSEVDSQLGKKEEIEFEDLHKLRYINSVFKETLRLYPPVTDVVRVAEKDINFDDFVIPKDAWIDISIYACGRDEDIYKNANKFDPDRFFRDGNEGSQNYSYLPFSLGPRNCIGQNFAQIEAKVLMAKFFQNFDYTLDPNQSFEMAQDSTLKPKDGTKCFLSIRF